MVLWLNQSVSSIEAYANIDFEPLDTNFHFNLGVPENSRKNEIPVNSPSYIFYAFLSDWERHVQILKYFEWNNNTRRATKTQF